MADEIKFTDSTTDLSEGESNATLGEKAWYVVNTYSTHENKVKENLKRRVESMGLGDLIFRIIVAEQEVPVMKDGMPTDKTRKKNLYPGYVFVEMIMTDYAWYVVRNTPGVTGFVGSSGKGTKPFPVPREQIEPVLKRMGEIDADMFDRYSVDDYVKVIHGPLEGTEGRILSINRDTKVVELETIFFGRSTRVEVDFSEIDKIQLLITSNKKPASYEAGFIFTFRCNRMRPCILLCVLMVSCIVGNKRNHDGTTNGNQDLHVDTRIHNHSIHT